MDYMYTLEGISWNKQFPYSGRGSLAAPTVPVIVFGSCGKRWRYPQCKDRRLSTPCMKHVKNNTKCTPHTGTNAWKRGHTAAFWLQLRPVLVLKWRVSLTSWRFGSPHGDWGFRNIFRLAIRQRSQVHFLISYRFLTMGLRNAWTTLTIK